MNAIDEAIAAAQHKAAQAPATTQAVAVSAPVVRGTPMSLEDFAVGSMSVDDWLKVGYFGITIGNDEHLLESVDVIIDPSQVQVCQAIKFGNPAVYLKTYDGVSCVQGGSWEQAQVKAQQADPKARPYPSADIPMQLISDLQLKGKVVEAGTMLGHSTSTTNKANFQTFIKALTDLGLRTVPVRVRVGYQKRTNQAGNKWGVLTFDLLGPAEEEADAAE